MAKNSDLAAGAAAAILFILASAVGPALAQDFGQLTPDQLSQYGYPHAGPAIGFNVMHLLMEVIAGVLGFAIGAFFSPLLRPFRRLAMYAAIAIVAVYTWLFDNGLSSIAGSLFSVLIFGIALGYGLRLGYRELQRQRELHRPTSYGTAKWATHDHLKENELFDNSGFFLGTFFERGVETPLHYAGDRHLLTVAPTRSGKGVSSILPNLLTYEGSALIVDPKGENALISAARRGAGDKARGIPGMHQEIHLLDPWDLATSASGLTASRFNPLDWIQAEDPDAAENAMLLADALVTQEPGTAKGGGDGRFWDEEAKALLSGFILYVAITEEEAGNRTLGRVRDLVTLDQERLATHLKKMAKSSHPVVSSAGYRSLGKEKKLLSNVMAATQSHTHFLDSPRIRDSLSATDFAFEELKTKPMTVYLILPADRLQTYGRWMRMLIQQAITVNARNIRHKPKKPVLVLLDEMASFGRLTMIEQAYGLMAGFGIQLWGIVQDLSQLQRLYGQDGWQTFISNSGVLQYFGSRDEFTASYFSKLCGVTTVRPMSLSYAISRVFGSNQGTSTDAEGNTSTSSGTSTSMTTGETVGANEAQRQLAYPDELMVLQGSAQIIFVENFDPIRANKILWYEDPALRQLGLNLSTNPPPPMAALRPPMPRPPAPPAAAALASPTPVRPADGSGSPPPRPTPYPRTPTGARPSPPPPITPPRRAEAPAPPASPMAGPNSSSRYIKPDDGKEMNMEAPNYRQATFGGRLPLSKPPAEKTPAEKAQESAWRDLAAKQAAQPRHRMEVEPEPPYELPKTVRTPPVPAPSPTNERPRAAERVEDFRVEIKGSLIVTFKDGSVELTKDDGEILDFANRAELSEYMRRNR